MRGAASGGDRALRDLWELSEQQRLAGARAFIDTLVTEGRFRDGLVPQTAADLMWVHCASGYRASIAASLLDRTGRQVVLVDDDFDNAQRFMGIERG